MSCKNLKIFRFAPEKLINLFKICKYIGTSVQWLIRFNSLQPHALQHTRLPCPSPASKTYSNLCPSIQWCHQRVHLTLCHPLLLLPSIFPGIGVFSNESVLRINGQSIGVSASASVLPMNIQDWFLLGLTGLVSLQSKELSRVFSNPTVQKHQLFGIQLSL